MKVLCVICTHPWMKPAFVDGWESTGAAVEIFYYNRGLIRRDFSPKGWAEVQAMNTRLLEKARAMAQGLDLIFFSILDDYISVETLRQLRKLDVPLVNYHADMGYLWYRLLRTGKHFDLVCCAQQLYMDAYQRRGFRTLYLPFGSNDRWEGKTEDEVTWPEKFEGVRYLGSPIVDRPKILGYLYKHGMPLEIYGNHWDWYPRTPTPRPGEQQVPHPGPGGTQVKQNGFRLPLPALQQKGWHDTRYYFLPRLAAEGYSFLYGLGLKLKKQYFPEKLDVEAFYAGIPTWAIHGAYREDDFVRLVRTAAIQIGFSHMHRRQGPHTHQKQMRMRDVEIPMTGGFLLTEHCSETENYFEPGKHLDTYTTEADLLEKVRWYLDHPAEREKIALAGREHALAHHTWKHRFTELTRALGLSQP